MLRHISALACLGLLAACASAPQLEGARPARPLVLEQALVGETTGDGAVTTLTGDKTHFAVTSRGDWNGQVLTLVEDFRYDDGKQERKTWHLRRIADGHYRGTREDVIGEADVTQDGDTVRLDYNVTLDTALGKVDCRFRDLLYFETGDTIRNIATVSKLGLRMARVNIAMHPSGAK